MNKLARRSSRKAYRQNTLKNLSKTALAMRRAARHQKRSNEAHNAASKLWNAAMREKDDMTHSLSLQRQSAEQTKLENRLNSAAEKSKLRAASLMPALQKPGLSGIQKGITFVRKRRFPK